MTPMTSRLDFIALAPAFSAHAQTPTASPEAPASAAPSPTPEPTEPVAIPADAPAETEIVVTAPQERGAVIGGVSALHFSSLATLNLLVFVDLGGSSGLIRLAPWLSGTRISLGVDSLFDARTRVTDRAGKVPAGFERAWLDPLGRVVRFGLRKQF